MAQKPVKDRELLVQSTFTGHISKEVWVAQAIAGGELCVSRQSIKLMGFWEYKKQLLWGIFLFIAIPTGIHYLIKWDSDFGRYVIFGVWWVAIAFVLKYRSDRENLRNSVIKLLNIITAKKGDDYDSDQDYENERKRLVDELDSRIRSENWLGNLKGYFDNKKIWEEETKKQKDKIEKWKTSHLNINNITKDIK